MPNRITRSDAKGSLLTIQPLNNLEQPGVYNSRSAFSISLPKSLFPKHCINNAHCHL